MGWAGLCVVTVLACVPVLVLQLLGLPRAIVAGLAEILVILAWAVVVSFPPVGVAVVIVAARKACLGSAADRPWTLSQVYLTFAAGSAYVGILVMVLRSIHRPPGWGLGPAFPEWLLPAAPAWSPLLYLLAAVGSLWGLRVARELGVEGTAGRLACMACGWLLVVGLFSFGQIVVLHVDLVVTGGRGWRIKPRAYQVAWVVAALALPGLLVELVARGARSVSQEPR